MRTAGTARPPCPDKGNGRVPPDLRAGSLLGFRQLRFNDVFNTITVESGPESLQVPLSAVLEKGPTMKLWYSPASPFVRKCLIVAHERDLTDRIEIMDANANVVDPDMRIVQSNPAGKIPTMVLDDGQVLFDSRVICAWLDTLHDGKKLMPRSGAKRFEVMTLEALGDAIMDAAVSNRYETALRPPEYQWKAWSDGQMGKVKASLDQLEKQWIRSLGRNPNMGSIAVAAALGYLDFRYPDLNWRRGRPKLTRWFKRFGERPSFMETEPK